MPADAQTDMCPAPIVQMVSMVNGLDRNEAARTNQVTAADAAILNERARSRVFNATSGVEFVGDVYEGRFAEFVLQFDETVEAGQRTQSIRLIDYKGRTVVTAGPIPFTSDQLQGDAAESLVDRVTGPVLPLLQVIRTYQRRVRKLEQSAISARIRSNPRSSAVAPGEPTRVEFALVDCDAGSPPLPGRTITVEVRGVGVVDSPSVTTDRDGKATVEFKSAEGGEADLIPEWRYENAAGVSNAADAQVATVSVRSGGGVIRSPIGFSRVSVAPRTQPQSEENAWYLGYLWVLTDDVVEQNYPAQGTPRTLDTRKSVCEARRGLGDEDIVVPLGGRREWTPRGTSGRQEARSRIEATFDGTTSARLHLALNAHGEPESGWDEEDGSEVQAVAAFEFVVDIDNAREEAYELVITPRDLRGSTSGAGEFTLSVFFDAIGCRERHASSWQVNLEGADGRDQNRSGRGTRLTIDGDPYVQLVFNISGTAAAWGQKMEAPFVGDAEIVLALELAVKPLTEELGAVPSRAPTVRSR